jgi:hypothetical protein
LARPPRRALLAGLARFPLGIGKPGIGKPGIGKPGIGKTGIGKTGIGFGGRDTIAVCRGEHEDGDIMACTVRDTSCYQRRDRQR